MNSEIGPRNGARSGPLEMLLLILQIQTQMFQCLPYIVSQQFAESPHRSIRCNVCVLICLCTQS